MSRSSGFCLRSLSATIPAGMFGLAVGTALATATAFAAVTVEQALKLTPVQKEVDYDCPAAADVAKCTIKAEKTAGKTGWVVRDGHGQPLRNFVDSNADNVVDLWCYYKDGLEVYRDVDSNFNGKADQCRWFNTAGARWGVLASDDGKDGRIESWRIITAEEVTAEFIAALRDADVQRFERLLITPKELKSLGLGAAKTAEISRRLDGARAAFHDLAKQQKVVGSKSRWTYFGAVRPGIVPAGADGSESDVMVYENVFAMVETDGKPGGQMPVGTLVRSQPDVWRLLGAPAAKEASDAQKLGGVMPPAQRFGESSEPLAGRPSEAVTKLLEELGALDKEPPGSLENQIKQNVRRADILEKLAAATDGDQHVEWLKQLSDSISAGSLADAYPDGVARLKALFENVRAGEKDPDLLACVEFRAMFAEWAESLRQPGADYVKIQTKWLADLQDYCTRHARSADACEGMIQLANALELAGDETKAMQWYNRLLEVAPPDSSQGAKAKGAVARLNSVGKVITLHGKGLDGKPVDLAKYKGKVVLIHYWAAEYDPCKADMPLLQAIQAKYAPGGFTILSISLDKDPVKLSTYLRQNRLPWEQIYEGGGLDGRLANDMGILTFPTMLLVDKQGRVVNRSIHAAELDAELSKMNLLSPPAAKAKP